jgi:MFS family permease
MITPAILTVALLTIMAGAVVAPAIASIARAFPEASNSTIKLVLTLPALMVIPFALITSRLSRAWGKKKTLLLGLVLYLLSGVGGGLANSIVFLLICRAVLGISVGIVMPLVNALVSDFYKADKAARMMGWVSASSQVGGICGQLLSGVLAVFSWRYSFASYGVALVAIVLVHIYLPEPETGILKKGKKRVPFPLPVVFYALVMFLSMLVFYAVPVNISLFIENQGMGSAAVSGAASAWLNLTAFLLGLCFHKFYKFFGRYSMPTGASAIALGMFVFGQSTHLAAVFCALTLVGAGLGFISPLIFQMTRLAAGPAQLVSAMALVTSLLYLGQFLSPLVIDSLGAFCFKDDPATPFKMASWFALGLTGLALLHTIHLKLSLGKG